MFDRPDAILVVVPLLGASGIVLRSVILSTGVATGLLAAPLTVVGFLAAAAVIVWELFTCPAGGTGRPDDRDSTGLLGRWR